MESGGEKSMNFKGTYFLNGLFEELHIYEWNYIKESERIILNNCSLAGIGMLQTLKQELFYDCCMVCIRFI